MIFRSFFKLEQSVVMILSNVAITRIHSHASWFNIISFTLQLSVFTFCT